MAKTSRMAEIISDDPQRNWCVIRLPDNAVQLDMGMTGLVFVQAEFRDRDPDTHFFYVVNADNPVLTMIEVKPVWDSLTFVKEGRAYPLGGDNWLFGDPLSAELLVDIVVKALMPEAYREAT